MPIWMARLRVEHAVEHGVAERAAVVELSPK